MASNVNLIGTKYMAPMVYYYPYTYSVDCYSIGKHIMKIETLSSGAIKYTFTTGTTETVYDGSNWTQGGYILVMFPTTQTLYLNNTPTSAPTFSINSLVYDRTSTDISYAKSLFSKGYDNLTTQEKRDWDNGLKGCYNKADFQRVSNAVRYAGILACVVGKNTALPSSLDYRPWSVVGYADFVTRMATYDTYVTLPSATPAIPTNSFNLTIEGANAIEEHLYAVIEILQQEKEDMIEPLPEPAYIYGVSNVYSQGAPLTRTDDAVGMSAVVNSSTGAVSSDFDDVFPWNEATVETINGNKFLHMPEMWFRVGVDSSYRITDIAVSKEAHNTGSWYKVDSFYYSCYGASLSNDNKMQSVSGVTRLAGRTRAEFRAFANANGNGYFQLDLYHHTVMVFLWLIEFANKNSQSIMTGATNRTTQNTGGTDGLTTPSGFNTTTQQMRYHYIEDFVGNYYEFIEGAVGDGNSGSTMYVTANPALFGDTSTGMNALPWNSPLPYSYTLLMALGWDANNPFLSMPNGVANRNGYDMYFFDSATYHNRACYYVGANVDQSTQGGNGQGLTSFRSLAAASASLNCSSRLLYKPQS